MTEVWQGQGWFSDIDIWLRSRKYELGHMDIEFSRPENVKTILHRGEPLWGKAIYLPGLSVWRSRQDCLGDAEFRAAILKSLILSTILDIPGRAIDLISQFSNSVDLTPFSRQRLVTRIFDVYKYVGLDNFRTRIVAHLRRLTP